MGDCRLAACYDSVNRLENQSPLCRECMSPGLGDAREAARKYRSTGTIAASDLREVIYRSWERSHLQGANFRALQAEKLSSLETERLLGRETALIDAARPYLRVLSQAAGTERHAVMLGDRNGIVLDVVGDERSVRGPESVPGPGSLLVEGAAGANGIGTPLAEDGYVEIIGPEHFIEGFHPFSCQGIPLRDEKRYVRGVLSISVRRTEAGQRLKEILLCATHGIEAELLQWRLQESLRRVLISNPNDSKPLEELHQDIIQAHNAGRLRLEAASRLVAKNRFDYARQLLQQADESIHLFRRRAALWRDLASSEIGSSQPLSLTDSVCDLNDLLSTEAAIRQIEVIIFFEEPVRVQADSRTLLRQLFHYFVQAFEIVGSGGTVRVEVFEIPHVPSAQVRWIPIPAPNRVGVMPVPLVLKLPLEKTSYEPG